MLTDQEIERTAEALVARGKGLLAMDESTPTCGKRFKEFGIENTAENRRAYREMLLGTPRLSQYISGAILYDETLRQTTADGMPLGELALISGIIPGIKVDAGAKDFAGHRREKITEGLDGLRDRLAEYRTLGARFAKWRAVITIGAGIPSRACIEANAHALARYAALSQEANLTPIVEPEILLDGDHTLLRCYEVTEATLNEVFYQLHHQDVLLSGMILKASMVLSGKACPEPATPEQVAHATIRCLGNTVPAAVPGVAFLSGGQTDLQATQNLNAMNRLAKDMHLPWRLSFSYARALQHAPLSTWRGDPANVAEAQQALLHRARCNSAASSGEYTEAMEHEVAT